jgi:hypothetical protein
MDITFTPSSVFSLAIRPAYSLSNHQHLSRSVDAQIKRRCGCVLVRLTYFHNLCAMVNSDLYQTIQQRRKRR